MSMNTFLAGLIYLEEDLVGFHRLQLLMAILSRVTGVTFGGVQTPYVSRSEGPFGHPCLMQNLGEAPWNKHSRGTVKIDKASSFSTSSQAALERVHEVYIEAGLAISRGFALKSVRSCSFYCLFTWGLGKYG